MLILEVDLTGLRTSKKAERSTKDYFAGERNATGRQLVRASALLRAPPESSPEERARTLIRLDGGFGTDENVGWLCSGG
jgi:hypothetical protein